MTDLLTWKRQHRVSDEAIFELLRIIDPTPLPNVPTIAKSEAAVQSLIQIEAARRGHALWRNNSGACFDQDGRMVRYGLGNTSSKLNAVFKSSDLIGIGPDGRFTAIEVKAPGWCGPKTDHENAQNNFLTTVRALGGIGMFAQSLGDVYT